MKIRELLSELDTPLDPAGTAVGRGVGKAGYGAGYAAGKIASKFGGSGANATTTDKDRSPSLLKAIGRGIKSGTYKYGTRGSSLMGSYSREDAAELIDRIVRSKQVNSDELAQLIRELPSMKVSWRVDLNQVKAALNLTAAGKPIDANQRNALSAFSRDLKEV